MCGCFDVAVRQRRSREATRGKREGDKKRGGAAGSVDALERGEKSVVVVDTLTAAATAFRN